MNQYQKDKFYRAVAHKIFDQLWEHGNSNARSEAYKTLTFIISDTNNSQEFSLGTDGYVHFSYMNSDQCLISIARLLSLSNDINISTAKKIVREYFEDFKNNPDSVTPKLNKNTFQSLREKSRNRSSFQKLGNSSANTRKHEVSEMEFFISQLNDFIDLDGIKYLDQRHQVYWKEINSKTEEQLFEYQEKLSPGEKNLDGDQKLRALKIREFAEYLYYQNKFTAFDLAAIKLEKNKPQLENYEQNIAPDKEEDLKKNPSIDTSTQKKSSAGKKSKQKKSPLDDDKFLEEEMKRVSEENQRAARESEGKLSNEEIMNLFSKKYDYKSLEELFNKISLHVHKVPKNDLSLIIILGEVLKFLEKSGSTKDEKHFSGLISTIIGKIDSITEQSKIIDLLKSRGQKFSDFKLNIIQNLIVFGYSIDDLKKIERIFGCDKKQVFEAVVKYNPKLLDDEDIRKIFTTLSIEDRVNEISKNIPLHENSESNIESLVSYLKSIKDKIITSDLSYQSRTTLANRIMIYASDEFSEIFDPSLKSLKKDGLFDANFILGAICACDNNLLLKLFDDEHFDDVKKLALLQQRAENGYSPIDVAVELGFSDIFRTLISYLEDDKKKLVAVQGIDKNGTPIFIRAACGENVAILEQILEIYSKNSEPEFGLLNQIYDSKSQQTPLFYCIQAQAVNSAQYILEKISSIDAIDLDTKIGAICHQDFEGKNALMFSAIKSPDIFESILAKLSSFNLDDEKKLEIMNKQNKQGLNAFDYAVFGSNESGNTEIVKAILEFIPEKNREAFIDGAQNKFPNIEVRKIISPSQSPNLNCCERLVAGISGFISNLRS